MLLRVTKMAEPEDEVPSMLLPCTICNRTFKPESLEKHAKICEKHASKKRKTFDSSKQRIQGTELAEFLPIIPKKEKSPVKKPQSLWKQKHMEFVRAIRQARGLEVPGKRTLSAVEQSRPANHEKCPHCERNFGPKAFDRHIEWCKEQKTRIPKSPANIVAKERLEARTKYRAPLSKSKRSITREKYSPVLRGGSGGSGGIREPSPMGSRSTVNCSTISVTSSSSNQNMTATAMPSIKGTTPRTSGSAPSSQRSSARESLSSERNTATRSSIQRRSSSPTKRPSLVRKDSSGGKRESTVPSPKKNSTNAGVQDLFSSSCSITRISPSGKAKAKNVPVINSARTKNKKNEVRSNRSPPPVNTSPTPLQLNPRAAVKKCKAVDHSLPDGKTQTLPDKPKQVKSISSYEGSQNSAGAEAVISTEKCQHHINKKYVTQSMKSKMSPRKTGSPEKQEEFSKAKTANNNKISLRKEKTEILDNSKIVLKKDISPRKINHVKQNTYNVSQHHKINGIAVNDDTDITVSSCNIYPSSRNLVTWQQLATGNVSSKPSINVESELNRTYTLIETEENADVLKLDLPCSSPSNSPEQEQHLRGDEKSPKNVDNSIKSNQQNSSFSYSSEHESHSPHVISGLNSPESVNRSSRKDVDLPNSSFSSSPEQEMQILHVKSEHSPEKLNRNLETMNEPESQRECVRNVENLNRSSSESFECSYSDSLADHALADDEGIDSGKGSNASITSVNLAEDRSDEAEDDLVVITQGARDLIDEMNNYISPEDEYDNIWEIAAQEFMKEKVCINFKNFYEGLDNEHLYSTPVKDEIRNSFMFTENNGMNLDAYEMKDNTEELMQSKLRGKEIKSTKIKIKSRMLSHLFMRKSFLSKSWSQQYFTKEKWLAALREKRITGNFVKKISDEYLYGPKYPKRKKLQDCNVEWLCSLVEPLNFCAGKNEIPFLFKPAKKEQINYNKCSKSEQNFCPRSDYNFDKHLESASAGNIREKRIIHHRNKHNRYRGVRVKKNDVTVKQEEEVGKCVPKDSLEHEMNNTCISSKESKTESDNTTIEYFGCMNSATEVSTENNEPEERIYDTHSKIPVTRMNPDDFECGSDDKRFTTISEINVEKMNWLEDKEFGRSRSLSVINSQLTKFEDRENDKFELKYNSPRKHKQSQKKTMFPKITESSESRVKRIANKLNLADSIKREETRMNKDEGAYGVFCKISLQEINQHSFELRHCKLDDTESQEKLTLPDISGRSTSGNQKSVRKETCKKKKKKKKEKPNFWEQQSKGLQMRKSDDAPQSKEGLFSRNPNAKKLPPLIGSSVHKRSRFPRFMKGNFAPSVPNAELILNSSTVPSGEVYDPYVSAERQMLELLSGDWSESAEKKNEKEITMPEPENKIIQPVSSPSPPSNELRTSPTSAFSKYSPVKPEADVPSQPDRSDQNSPSFECEELIISGHDTTSISSSHNISLSTITSLFDENDSNLSNHKELMISLSSICSIPNFDLNFELDMNVNRKSNRARYRKKLENAALALQQSVSLYHPGPVVRESQLEVEDVDNFPLASESDDIFSSPLQTKSSLSRSSPESKLATTSSFQNYEDSDHSSRPGSRKRLGDVGKSSAIFLQVEEDHDNHNNRRSIGSKISGDSAYSSLNRKSPLADVTSQCLERHTEVLLDADVRCLSSSGSESSLPPLCSTQVEDHRGKSPPLSSTPTPSLLSNADQSALKLSKFCHECGSKYPVTLAKFCCECGVRRLFV